MIDSQKSQEPSLLATRPERGNLVHNCAPVHTGCGPRRAPQWAMLIDLRFIRRRLDELAWTLLPGVCVLCGSRSRTSMDLCEPCREALPHNDRSCCACALPLRVLDDALCTQCLVKQPPFARAIAALRYVEPVTRMIHRLKFNGSRVDARVLGSLLAARVNRDYRGTALPELIVPVPLSRERLFRRGHNQAALLARWVGSTLDIAIDYGCCRRLRHTPPQTGLSRSARLRNLSGAFDVTRSFSNMSIALVDDVMTTGSTVTALTQTLLAAGAVDVHVWAAARTPQIDSETRVAMERHFDPLE